MLSIVVLISGSGSNLQAIMDAIASGHIRNARIDLVLSNRPNAYGLQRAQDAGLNTAIVNHRDYDYREQFDQAMTQVIDQYQADLVVLAGFMRILSDGFVQHYEGRMINIHPALLPAYKGLHTHRRALADGVQHHGASVHYVTPELDSGAVIAQGRVPVLQGDTEETLQQRVHRIEHIVYPEVIKWFAQGRLSYQHHQAYLDNQLLGSPVVIDLDAE